MMHGLELTRKAWHAKIISSADVVELVDSLDLGAVTSGKVFRPAVIANQCAHWCGNPFAKSRFACFYYSWIRLGAPPRIPLRVKIRGAKEYAGVVELADSTDLGAVTSVKVFPPTVIAKPVRRLVWQSVL